MKITIEAQRLIKIIAISSTYFIFSSTCPAQVISVTETKHYYLNLKNEKDVCCDYNNAGIIEFQIYAPQGCKFGTGGKIGSGGKWTPLPTAAFHNFWANAHTRDGGRYVTTTDWGDNWVMAGYPTWKTRFFYTKAGAPPLMYNGPISCSAGYTNGNRRFTAWEQHYRDSTSWTIHSGWTGFNQTAPEIEKNPPRTFSCSLPDIIDMGTSISGKKNVKKLGINCEQGGVLSIDGKIYKHGEIISGEPRPGLGWEINPINDEISVISAPDFTGNYSFQLAVRWSLP